MIQAPRSFDVVIIGGGVGGYVAAMRAAQLGLSGVVVEREELGGTCVNWGCIPSKAILRTAEVLHLIQNAKSLGITVGDVLANYTEALKRARDVATRQARGVRYLMRKYQVAVVRGAARVQSSDRISVEAEEGYVERCCCSEMGSTMTGLMFQQRGGLCNAFGVGASERGKTDRRDLADNAGAATTADAGLRPARPALSRTMLSLTT